MFTHNRQLNNPTSSVQGRSSGAYVGYIRSLVFIRINKAHANEKDIHILYSGKQGKNGVGGYTKFKLGRATDGQVCNGPFKHGITQRTDENKYMNGRGKERVILRWRFCDTLVQSKPSNTLLFLLCLFGSSRKWQVLCWRRGVRYRLSLLHVRPSSSSLMLVLMVVIVPHRPLSVLRPVFKINWTDEMIRKREKGFSGVLWSSDEGVVFPLSLCLSWPLPLTLFSTTTITIATTKLLFMILLLLLPLPPFSSPPGPLLCSATHKLWRRAEDYQSSFFWTKPDDSAPNFFLSSRSQGRSRNTGEERSMEREREKN